MGCDIHAHIEYRLEYRHKNVKDYLPFCSVEIFRNYTLFGLMAGVRSSKTPPIAPKGFPKDASWKVLGDATYFVIDDNEDFSEPGCCTKKQAEKWGNKYCNDSRVYRPDWHTFSWLTLEEFEKVLALYLNESEDNDVKFIERNEQGEFEIPDGYKLHPFCEDYDENGFEQIMIMAESKQVKSKQVDLPVDVRGVLGAMTALHESGAEPRLVFWFDN